MRVSKVCVILLALISTLYSQEVNFLGESEMISLEKATNPIMVSNEEFEDLRAFLLAAAEEDPEPEPEPTPSPVDPDKPKPSTIDNLINAFMRMTNKWAMIVDAFKTTRSSTLKQMLLGKGFDFFKQSAQMQIAKGIKEDFFDKYIEHLEKRIKVPEERQSDLRMVLEESRWAERNVWSAFNTLYSVDNGGNTKFSSILVARDDEKNTFDFVFTDMKAEFKLAPDVMVINKKLSVLGGIWEDEKDVQVKVPRTVTPEDIQMVMSFFNIVSVKGFCEQFGIDVEFPKM